MDNLSNFTTRCGFALMLGASNTGKSTLFNRLIGAPLASVSPRPQTTRTRVRGIWQQEQTQVIVIDVPGVFEARDAFDRAMVQSTLQALDEQPDCVLICLDATKGLCSTSRSLMPMVAKLRSSRTHLVLNKIDRCDRQQLLPLVKECQAMAEFDRVWMISALHGDGVDDMVDAMASDMPLGPWLYPADQISDKPQSLIAADITQGKIFHATYQEVPYGVMVIPVNFKLSTKKELHIHQDIMVSNQRYKPMIIGQKGRGIVRLGQQARGALSDFFQCRVHLFLQVKVNPRWRCSSDIRRQIGLDN